MSSVALLAPVCSLLFTTLPFVECLVDVWVLPVFCIGGAWTCQMSVILLSKQTILLFEWTRDEITLVKVNKFVMQWMRLWICVVERKCFIQESIPHATTGKSGVVFFGDSVTFTCERGYGVNGSTVDTQTIMCNAGETFDGLGQCKGMLKLTCTFIHLMKLLWGYAW